MADNPQCAILNIVGSVINGQYKGLIPVGWVPLDQGVNLTGFKIEYLDGAVVPTGAEFDWFEDPAAWNVEITEEIDPDDSTTKQRVYIRYDINLSLVPDLTSVYQVGGVLNGNAFHHCVYMPQAAATQTAFLWISSDGLNLFYANVGATEEATPLFTAGTGDLDYGPPELGSDGYVYFVHKETTKKIKRIKADGSDAGVATLVWDSGSTGTSHSNLAFNPNTEQLFFSIDTGATKGRINGDGTGITSLYNVAAMTDLDWIDSDSAIGRYGFWFNVWNAESATNEHLQSQGKTYWSGRVRRSDSRIYTIDSTTNELEYCALDLTGFTLEYDFDNVAVAEFGQVQKILGIDETGDNPQIYVHVGWDAGNGHIFRFNMNDYTDFTDLGDIDTITPSGIATDPDIKRCIRLAIKNIF